MLAAKRPIRTRVTSAIPDSVRKRGAGFEIQGMVRGGLRHSAYAVDKSVDARPIRGLLVEKLVEHKGTDRFSVPGGVLRAVQVS